MSSREVQRTLPLALSKAASDLPPPAPTTITSISPIDDRRGGEAIFGRFAAELLQEVMAPDRVPVGRVEAASRRLGRRAHRRGRRRRWAWPAGRRRTRRPRTDRQGEFSRSVLPSATLRHDGKVAVRAAEARIGSIADDGDRGEATAQRHSPEFRGAFSGHWSSRPVSREMPSCCGPRHWGQSSV